MGGFIPEAVHEIMQLPANEKPVAYLAVGHPPDEHDTTANPLPKIRLELEDIVRFHK